MPSSIIDRQQFTVLIAAVIGSAIVPTITPRDRLRRPCPICGETPIYSP